MAGAGEAKGPRGMRGPWPRVAGLRGRRPSGLEGVSARLEPLLRAALGALAEALLKGPLLTRSCQQLRAP